MMETQTKLKADGDNYRRLISEPGENEVFERFVEEAAAAAGSMQEQAVSLSAVVSIFQA
jgi:hypothetical protein